MKKLNLLSIRRLLNLQRKRNLMNRKKAIEVAVKSGGNRTSNKPGGAPAKAMPNNVDPVAKPPADRNKGVLETPKVAGQQLDAWAKAAAKAKGYFKT